MLDFQMIQRQLIATILLSVIFRANAFSYKDTKNWGVKYPGCKGKNQSPVMFDFGRNVGGQNDKEVKPTNFNKLPTKMTMKNTGHTVELKADWSGEPPKMSGGPLQGSYEFEKITFHWARKAWSEGLDIDHEPFMIDMEVHLFFYQTDLKSFENAESKKDGLAVFRGFIDVGYDDPDKHILDDLEKNLHKVQFPNSTAVIRPIRILHSLLRYSSPPFDYYKGSLDYPPCSESVIWIHYEADLPISKNLVKELRKIKLAEGDVSNMRPHQALNGRKPKPFYVSGGLF